MVGVLGLGSDLASLDMEQSLMSQLNTWGKRKVSKCETGLIVNHSN